MATFIIVKKEDLSIQGSYEAGQKDDTPANRSWLHAESICMHLVMPGGLDPECVKYENEEIVADSTKVSNKLQSQRETKLALMRSKRAGKMLEVDIMINELVLGARSDATNIATYRAALKDITNVYKNNNGDSSASCDVLNADLSDLVWPTKP